MAYLQSDLPPSTAPVSTARARITPARTTSRSSGLITRLVVAAFITALLAVLGIAAARATESLAIGVIAADLAFLVAVAVWSSVYGGPRR